MLQVGHFISFFPKFEFNLLVKGIFFLLNVVQCDAQIVHVCNVPLSQLPQTVILLTLYSGGSFQNADCSDLSFLVVFLGPSTCMLGCTLQ